MDSAGDGSAGSPYAQAYPGSDSSSRSFKGWSDALSSLPITNPDIVEEFTVGYTVKLRELIDTGKFPFEKINNRIYKLEDLAQAIKDTEERPEGFIKGAIMF